jgi:hypothetical protein
MRSYARFMSISSTCALAAVVLGAALLSAPAAMAQAKAPGPFNLQVQPSPIFNDAAKVAGTYNSQQFQNTQWKGVVCSYNMTGSGGSPSVTFKIQGFDAATAAYYDLQTSGAITNGTNPVSVMVSPGGVATGAPTGMTASALHLPALWRVQEIVAGSNTPTTTGKLGCSFLN